MSKQFLAVIVGVFLALGGLYALTSGSDSTSSNAKPTTHVQGEGNKGVTLVEYGDFQCPFCGQYYPTLEEVIADYGDDIKFQFRHFPLPNIHQNAFAASRAAEAAGKQDKFFEMYDMLYQNQQLWERTDSPQATFETYATRIGLDLEKYKTDYASAAVNAAINADMAEGARLKVQGTPTFFLNGKRVQINNTVADFKKAIDNEIAKQNPVKADATQESQLPADSTAPAGETMPADGTAAPAANAAN